MEQLTVELLGTRELQRLRRVRHLGLARLVFPGAEHSRFVHAIGAAHLASRFSETLRRDSDRYLPRSLRLDEHVVRDLLVAALCHDLGHGPLSHAWEQNVIGDFTPETRSSWAACLGLGSPSWLGSVSKWHELVTQALVLCDGELRDSLEKVETGSSERVAALLGGRFYLPHLTTLLSSDVDVDRCDFVLRDAYQSGVAYGRYDLNWLISTATFGVDISRDIAVIGFDADKAPRVVEQLLIARRALYDTCYHHPGVRSAEAMVGALLRRVKVLAKSEPSMLEPVMGFPTISKAISGSPLTVNEFLELDDDSLWVFVDRIAKHVQDPAAKELARRIVARDLFKRVPLSSDELDRLLTQVGSDIFARIDRELQQGEVLRGLDVEDWSSFRLVDRADFRFFHEGDEYQGRFVDTSSSARSAKLMADHEMLKLHQPSRTILSLFVPRESVRHVHAALTA
jgi:HD superfamily phosphohydrolase